jgi:hypothetical protein
MARTPDRRPGEADEEGIVLENRPSGDNPTVTGGIRYVDGAFSFKDSLGLFNPRSPLSAAGYDTELQYNYLGFLSASSDLRFARDRRALVATNISGSLTKLSDGTSFIIAGGNISVVTGSNGSISLSTINSGTISGVTPGTGLLGGGSSGSVSLGINDSIVATISGSTFTGAVKFNSGLSGSLTRLADGTSYIASGVGINVATGSTGRITVSLSNTGSAGTFGSQSQIPVFATDAQGRVTGVTSTSIQISEAQVTNLTSSLNDRAVKATSITAGNGLSGGGDLSTNRTLSINNSVVATLSGSTFSGVVNFNAGLSGSLTRLTSGDPFIIGGSNVIVTTGSNGTIVIDAVGGTNGGSLVDGFGTANYVSRWQDTNTLTDSIIYDDGISVGIGKISGGDVLSVSGSVSITGSLLPGTDSLYSLGSEGKRWNVFASNLRAHDESRFSGNILPDIHNNYDIGTTSNNWRNIYASNISGSLTGSGLQLGSVVFAGPGGLITGSNSRLFWDNDGARLGIGTNSPDASLKVFGTSGSLFTVTDSLSGSLFSVCGVSGVPIFEVFSDNRAGFGGGFNGFTLTVTGSLVGLGTSTPAGRFHAMGSSIASLPVAILQAGSASPTAKVLDVRNSSGATVASIDHTGILSASHGSFSANVAAQTITAAQGFSGSLTRLADGKSYLVAGSNIGITTGSNGSVTIFSSMDGAAVIAGANTQIQFNDSGAFGASSGLTYNKITQALTGTYVVASTGFSGSLTRLTDGSSYLVAGAGIAITTGSNGSVVITNDGTVGDIASVNAGTGLLGGGTSGHVTLNINDSVVATISGATFTGATRHTAGLSGSLTNLTDGSSYLRAGDGITVITGSNGSVTISLGAITYATASFTDATSVTVNHDIGLSLYDIEVFDSDYGKMIPKSATATSPTQANIQFSIPTSGWIAVGGPVAGGAGASTLGSITTSVGSAPYLGSRAWVSFNGTGTVAIRSSQNVSSITDNGVGKYTVNFTVQMEDANYALVSTAEGSSGSGPLICGPLQGGTYSTSAVAVHAMSHSGTDADSEKISVLVSR